MIVALCAVLAQAPLDQGTFVVTQDTAVLARESFRLARGPVTGGGAGWILASNARYDRERPIVTLSPVLEIGDDTTPVTLQYDVADPRQPVRVLAQVGRGRITVHIVARGAERAREFAVTGPALVLDDSVFAAYIFAAWLAAPAARPVTAVFARGLRRETLTVQDLGSGPTTLHREPATLRHVTVTGGVNQLVHLWLDGPRLMKIEVPSRHIVAEREAAG